MYCGKCGKEIEEGADFCPYCGNIIEHKNERRIQVNLKKGLIIFGIIFAVFLLIFCLIQINRNSKYKQFIENGDQFFAEADYERAIGAYFSAYMLKEKDASVCIKLGNAYVKTNALDAAKGYYQKALENDNQNMDAYWGMLNTCYKNGEEDEFDQYLNQAYEISTGEDKTLIEKIKDLAYKEKVYEALDSCMLKWSQGGGAIQTDNVIKTIGLCCYILLDYDGDGIDDILKCYTENEYDLYNLPITIDDYVIEIWGYKNGEVKLMESGKPHKFADGCQEIALIKNGNGWKITENDIPDSVESKCYLLWGERNSKGEIKTAFMVRGIKDQKLAHIRSSLRQTLNRALDVHGDKELSGGIQSGSYKYETDNQAVFLCAYQDETGQSCLEIYYAINSGNISTVQGYIESKFNEETGKYETENTANGEIISIAPQNDTVEISFDGPRLENPISVTLEREMEYDL